ncbi:hypothetical protein FBD94_16725 [Pedobacter hiemivivus]|uniref:Uncharacterized protein n=1 Tax=Pedobacter hiemivivus TaxID=2530454 RepID=A0A4U1G660_9SPHI|nr:hypothetical protein [Pedobacter hiemivivus]TKC59175.1 hypothetical protein FBD94_16725 [Pedobacter hiemivivus]
MLFIFQYMDSVHFQSPKSVTVVFIHQESLDNQGYVADEIKKFFQINTLSDYVLVLLPDYFKAEQQAWFTSDKENTFKRLPGKSAEYFEDHYFVYTYDQSSKKKSVLKPIIMNHDGFFKKMFRHGSTEIFIKNGGLVESSVDHHFVFPSKKHCSKFIRTGNVLGNSSEVFFIAYQLMPYFLDRQTVYCDTSSINVLPFAVYEFQRRFKIEYQFPNVHSFISYEVFESRKTPFGSNDLILISSSTSGNIIDRMLKQRLAVKEQMLLIYYLGSLERYLEHENNIMCNLSQDGKNFITGIEPFETYPNEEACQLCKNNSYPISIEGDVFLTVKPKLKKLLLTATAKHVPKFLNDFLKQYRVNKSADPNKAIIRAYYKETTDDPDANYETYIDTSKIYDTGCFKAKLNRLINKHVPANTKYLIHLPDESSKRLAEIIKSSASWKDEPDTLKLDSELARSLVNKEGCAVIVASCIVTGKNLLHVSRMMRAFDQLSLVYFIGVLGTNNIDYLDTLKKNLTKGKDNSHERQFISVETIYCALDKYNTNWAREKVFLEEKVLPEMDDQGPLYTFFKQRLEVLRDNKESVGLAETIFLRTHQDEVLYLRKSFAFWDFDYHENEIFQSEVFFTINSIINHLENKEITSDESLQQSNYVRTLLSTENFQRFNDGIIQASLLRSSKPEYLAYDLDNDSSKQMSTLIESQIEKHESEHSEALMEFLLAIGMKTLRLSRIDTSIVLEKAKKCPNLLISEFANIIVKELMKEHLL